MEKFHPIFNNKILELMVIFSYVMFTCIIFKLASYAATLLMFCGLLLSFLPALFVWLAVYISLSLLLTHLRPPPVSLILDRMSKSENKQLSFPTECKSRESNK